LSSVRRLAELRETLNFPLTKKDVVKDRDD
jgi:hypothetical protein